MRDVKIKGEIDKKISTMSCTSSDKAYIGIRDNHSNNTIIRLANIRWAINNTWSQEMLEKTDCLIKTL